MAGSHSTGKAVRTTDPITAKASANASKDVSIAQVTDVSLQNYPEPAISRRLEGRTSALTPPRRLRHFTVGYNHPYVGHNSAYPHAPAVRPEPPRVPFLRLQGRWLDQAGFAIGTPVRVLVAPGRLVLEVDETA